MKLKLLVLMLVCFATTFLLSCSQKPEFTYFGFWVEVEGKKIEIPKATYNPILNGTNELKKQAGEVVLGVTDKPTFYYYGDIPASSLKLQEIRGRDSVMGLDIAPLEQAGAYKVTPKTDLSRGVYYTFILGDQAYPLYISPRQAARVEGDKLAFTALEPMEAIHWTDGRAGCVSIQRNGVSNNPAENVFQFAAWNCHTGKQSVFYLLSYDVTLDALSANAATPENDMQVKFLSGKDIEVAVTDRFREDNSWIYFPNTVTRYYRQDTVE